MPLLRAFEDGGWPNWVIVVLGITGIALAIASMMLSAVRSPLGRWIGISTLLLAALMGAVGVLGVLRVRTLAEYELRPPPRFDERGVQRFRADSYEDAKGCAKLGLGFAALPLLAGAFAVLARSARTPDAPIAAPEPAPAPAPTLVPTGAAAGHRRLAMGLGLGALALACALALVNVLIIGQPPPTKATRWLLPEWLVPMTVRSG